MTLDKVLDKLGKLKAHMESAKEIGNEEEAQAFAGMLQSLLAKHKLEMSDLTYSSHLQDEPVAMYGVGEAVIWQNGQRVLNGFPEVKVKKTRVAWCERLCSVIANAHSCKMVVATGSSFLYLVGRKSDVAVAEYLFITMQRFAEKMAEKEYVKYFYECRELGFVEQARGFKSAWLVGFINRLYERFEDEKAKLASQYAGTALVRLNREALAVKEYVDKNTKPANGVTGRQSDCGEGYRRGKKAADGLNLKANAMEAGENSGRKLSV